MPLWLSITLCVLCMLWALQQVRMLLMYKNVLKGPFVGTPALVYTALGNAISFTCYGLIFLLIKWPKFITYILAVLLLKAIWLVALTILGRNPYLPELTPKGKRSAILVESAGLLKYAIPLVVSALWLGY